MSAIPRLIRRLRSVDRLAGKIFYLTYLMGRGAEVRRESLYLLRRLRSPDMAPHRAMLSTIFASLGDRDLALRLSSPELTDEIAHNFSNLSLCILGERPVISPVTEPWVLTSCSHLSPSYDPLEGYRAWLKLRDTTPTSLEYQKAFVISWTACRDEITPARKDIVEESLAMLKLSDLGVEEAKLHTYTNLAVSLRLLGDERYVEFTERVNKMTESQFSHVRVMAYQSLMEFSFRTGDRERGVKVASELKRRASNVATGIMSREPSNRAWLMREVSLNCLSLAKVQYWTGDLTTSTTIRRLLSFLKRSELSPVISTFLWWVKDVELALELGSNLRGLRALREEIVDISTGLASIFFRTGDERIPSLVMRNGKAVPPFLRHLGCRSLSSRLRVELGYC